MGYQRLSPFFSLAFLLIDLFFFLNHHRLGMTIGVWYGTYLVEFAHYPPKNQFLAVLALLASLPPLTNPSIGSSTAPFPVPSHSRRF
ncbi:hypothetical protein HDK77DRAFT_211061 [Phyllosticta capitalensis]|uniref:Uncharacterized protein n=1 Tax=Phyllosticta capitalensis TaxID=121624 RepID=A0ABR1Z3T9_9PEZI